MENKILAEKLQKTSTEHSVITSCNNDGNSREFLLAKHHSTVTYEKGNDYSSCGVNFHLTSHLLSLLNTPK